MKKIILFLLVCFILGLKSFCQEVNYTIIDNDAENYKRTGLTIDLWHWNLNHANTFMGFGSQFETQVSNFQPWVKYSFEYLSFVFYRDYEGLNEIKNPQSIELGTGIILKIADF